MSTNLNNKVINLTEKTTSLFDPFNTGLVLQSFGNFMSTRNSMTDVSMESWNLLDSFLKSLPKGVLTDVVTHLSQSASQINNLYHDKVAKNFGAMQASDRQSLAMSPTYGLYISNCVRKVMIPIDTLSMHAVNLGADTFKVSVSPIKVEVQTVVKDVVSTKITVDAAIESGTALIKTHTSTGVFDSNPNYSDYVEKLNNSVPMDNPVEKIRSGSVTISGCPLRSIVTSIANGRVWGNAQGLPGTVRFDDSDKVEFLTSGSDMVYYYQETPVKPKSKIHIPNSSKFVDIGLDLYGLGASNELSKSVRNIEHGDKSEDYRDSESRLLFETFVVTSKENVYYGHFNFSWYDAIKKKHIINGSKELRDRFDRIVYTSRYYYCTSGAVDWMIECGAEVTCQFNDKNILHGPALVRKIFGYWNFSRIITPDSKLKFSEGVHDYCIKFLKKQSVGLGTNMALFCSMAFSKLGNTYTANIVARNMYQTKKVRKIALELGISGVPVDNINEGEYDPYEQFDHIHIENNVVIDDPNFRNDSDSESDGDDIFKDFSNVCANHNVTPDLLSQFNLTLESAYDLCRVICQQLGGERFDFSFVADLTVNESQKAWINSLSRICASDVFSLLGYIYAVEWKDANF